ncbi:putative membrane protein YeiH [Thermovibrio guaymasensis]|uniref:Putative membrane protein YeiH n=1 Tax=Thermovibrio guaymasensis TaxID=240167 RepID=A0A420W9K0_9BACT|nr:trimeric intracellular cation channel family protein [Thermovibrio guaymasensis]RKQ63964.1 putative membrane protein YeiH [Thermovibrio guaymasensis]
MASISEVLEAANCIGLVAFALSGVFKGINAKLDLLGVSILGFLTALGGGIVRDILVNSVPKALTGISDITTTALGIFLALLLYKVFRKDITGTKPVKIIDAAGLSAFSVTGFLVGAQSGLNGFGIVLLGVITGTGGGLISELLTGKVPSVLKEDFYASCSLIGGILFLITYGKFSTEVSTGITFVTILTLRLTAILKGWRLPRFGLYEERD